MLTYASWKVVANNKKIRYVQSSLPTFYLAGFGQLGKNYLTRITENADIADFEANIKPGAISVSTESDLLELSELDSRIGSTDGRIQRAFEFGTSVIYIGYAEVGLAQSAVGWTIKKLDLDASGNPISEKWTAVGTAIWNNRLSETYS